MTEPEHPQRRAADRQAVTEAAVERVSTRTLVIVVAALVVIIAAIVGVLEIQSIGNGRDTRASKAASEASTAAANKSAAAANRADRASKRASEDLAYVLSLIPASQAEAAIARERNRAMYRELVCHGQDPCPDPTTTEPPSPPS